LIEGVAGNLLRKGSGVSLGRWLDTLPEETVRARPRLCLARGWTIFMGPGINLENAESWAQLALQVAEADGVIDSDLTGEVAALQSMIAITRGDVARSRKFAQEALVDLAIDSPWRSAVTFSLATTNLDFGDIVAATQAFEEALRLSQAEGDLFVQLACASFLADIEVFQGHLNRATEMYQKVLAWSDPDLPQKGTVMAHGGLASILYERDQLDDAHGHIQLGFGLVDQAGGEYAAFVLNRVLARLQQARGNWRDALEILNQAYKKGQRARVSLVMRQAPSLRANLHLAQGNLAAATIWAENSELSPDDEKVNHPGWKEVEYLTLARLLTAQGRQAEAISLLERLLRSAQVDGRSGSAIEILVLQALIDQAQGNMTRALEHLERALTLAEPEGYVRIFVDEGIPMRELLLTYQSTLMRRTGSSMDKAMPRLLTYVEKLLAAFPLSAPAATHASGSTVEPLSERELEIMNLISLGMSNQEIAERLVIATSTVKSHINNLYAKLGTHSRTRAVAIARQLGLFSG
jgi:LuxR family maltose regulon positive regulatory protein